MKETPASELLRADHRQMETHLDGLRNALRPLSIEGLEAIRRHFHELQQRAHLHLEQEERLFYPAVRELAPELLARMDRQHQDIRETEQFLESFLASLPAFPSERDLGELFRLGIEFHDAVQCHIVEEEDHLLKFADEQLAPHEQQGLAAAMQKMAAGTAPP